MTDMLHKDKTDAITISGLHGRKFFNFFFKPSKATIKDLHYSDSIFYSASQFHHLLRIERKRTSRSKKPFLLALLDFSALEGGKHYGYMIEKTKGILISCTRETDILGWYENDRIMGVIFTEMAHVDKKVIENIFHKIRIKMGDNFTTELANKIVIYPHVFGSLEDNEKLKVTVL
jgi:hypothetical protein